jgi:LysM repeat protein
MPTQFFQWATVLAVAFWASGCHPLSGSSASDVERNPDYRRARLAAEAGDARVAVVLLEKVLRAQPGVASLHLELGLLYDQKLQDPIAAIYHYRQFLELEPASPRKTVVEGHIERAKLALAARLPVPQAADAQELMRLQAEKAALQEELAVLRLRLAEREAAGHVAGTAGAPAEPLQRTVVVTQTVLVTAAPTSSPPPRMYVVQRGDTLQSIARAHYGTAAGWERIYLANRASLPSKDQLRVGQTLVIP